jgi:hypothetical protein
MEDFEFRFPEADRRNWIISHCRGRAVLHLGCMANPGTLDQHTKGMLLHPELFRVAESLVGIDLDAKTNRELFPPDSDTHWIREADAENQSQLAVATASPITGLRWVPDVIVAAEIVEHLSNPGLTLTACKRLTDHAKLLVTVPNAFARNRCQLARRGIERVHVDHVAWYSPRTITSLLERHGWYVQSIAGYRGRGMGAAGLAVVAES